MQNNTVVTLNGTTRMAITSPLFLNWTPIMLPRPASTATPPKPYFPARQARLNISVPLTFHLNWEKNFYTSGYKPTLPWMRLKSPAWTYASMLMDAPN